jgi:cysteinyl-tRNA synthetase
MCSHHLDGTVDIHGGGADLIFPHHENEIAQSEAYLGREPFARYWVHNGLLNFAGDKMSKSLGNFIKVRDLLDRGLGTAFRLMVLQSHYRAPLNFSEEGLESADRGLDRLRAAAKPVTGADASAASSTDGEDLAELAAQTDERFHRAMDDDFDSPVAVAALFDLARAINRARTEGRAGGRAETARQKLVELAGILGLELEVEEQASAGDAEPFIDLLVSVRDQLRAAKQWQLADVIREGLAERGIVIADGPTGSTWSKA